MTWIKIEDKKPDSVFDWVLVNADGAVDCFGYSEKRGFHNPTPYDRSTNVVVSEITEWMPIPSNDRGKHYEQI